MSLMGDPSRIAATTLAATLATGLVREARTLDGRRLVYQHDGDPITHWISEFVALADQRVFGFAILEWPLALRADEDFE